MLSLIRWAIFGVAWSAVLPAAAATESITSIELSDRCPPYLALDPENRCILNTLYDIYPAANPLWGGYRVSLPPRRDGFTPQQIDLGRYLFFDPVLSVDGDLSCASCHHPDFSLSDGRATSIGRHGTGVGPARSGGEVLTRSAPPLWNMAFQRTFFWDGRAASLEAQIETVLTTEQEMANTPERVVASLNAISAYRSLFAQAYGSPEIRFEQVLGAIAAFETTLVSLNSRYDRYIHGAQDELSEREVIGLNIFRSFATRCSQCHTPPLFSSGQLATTGVPAPADLPFDIGAQATAREPSLRGAFKVPTLRNIAHSAPYMHAGQFPDLGQAVAFYNAKPGHAVSEQQGLVLNWHMVEPKLRADETEALIAFLRTLSDETARPAIPALVPSGLPVLR